MEGQRPDPPKERKKRRYLLTLPLPVHLDPITKERQVDYARGTAARFQDALQAYLLSAMSVKYPWFCPLVSTKSVDPFGVAVWLNASPIARVLADGTTQQGYSPGLHSRSLAKLKEVVDACLAKPEVKLIGFTLIINLNHFGRIVGCGHANALIYDKELNTVERWEPNGLDTSLRCDPGHKLDANLAWLFNSLFGWKYVTPQSSCPRFTDSPRRGRVQGHFAEDNFCISWSLLYIETRLANPGMSGELISRLLAKQAAASPEIAESAVRRYAALVMQAYNDHARFKIPTDIRSLVPVTTSAVSAVVGGRIPDAPGFPYRWPPP